MRGEPKQQLKIVGIELPSDPWAPPTAAYSVTLKLSRRMTRHEEDVFQQNNHNVTIHGNAITVIYTTVEQIKANKELWSQRVAAAEDEGARHQAIDDEKPKEDRAAREAELERRQKIADEIKFE
jgi:hypothetical protein